MATGLERRIDHLEAQGAERWPRRPFADWTDEELRAEMQRLESGMGVSESALAAVKAMGVDDGNT